MSDSKIGVILEKVLSRPISFHRIFATIGGGAAEGLFLSQAYYWSFRTTLGNGWFYKTAQQWGQETALTRREQERSRKRLIGLGILEEKREGLPSRLYYRVNRSKLYKIIEKTSLNSCDCQIVTNDKLDCKNSQTSSSDVANNLYTENTYRDYNRDYLQRTPPIIPQGVEEGESNSTIAEIVKEEKLHQEVIEAEVVENLSFSSQEKQESRVEPESHSKGLNVPASENHSHFVPSAGKDISTGKPCNPWIGKMIDADGGVVDNHCLEPGFLNYLIKFHSDTRYFKNKTGAGLEIAIASWAQKTVPGRQQQVSQLWRRYKQQENSPLSGMTLGEAEREYKRSQRNAKLNQWIRE